MQSDNKWQSDYVEVIKIYNNNYNNKKVEKLQRKSIHEVQSKNLIKTKTIKNTLKIKLQQTA